MHSFRCYSAFLLTSAVWLHAQTSPSPETPPPVPAAPADKFPVELEKFIVSGQLDRARENIAPSLGATSFFIGSQQIADLPQGADAPFSSVLLRAPGIAGDSAANGDLHLRGEHANLQYRINDVLLPEGELEARRAAWVPPVLLSKTPWEEIYRSMVGQQGTGACLEPATLFLDVLTTRGESRNNH